MSNRDKLKDAGIIKPDRTLTDDESEAIESLTNAEVESLISTNGKLFDYLIVDNPQISGDNPFLEMPGRNTRQST